MDDYEYDRYDNLEDEKIYGGDQGRSMKSAEKRLDSPITDGLSRRLTTYAAGAQVRCPLTEKRNQNLAISWTSWLQAQEKELYSGILPRFKQFSKVCQELNFVPTAVDPKLYPDLYAYRPDIPTFINEDFLYSKRIFENAVDGYMSWVSDVLTNDAAKELRRKILDSTKPSYMTTQSAKASQIWSRVVDRYRDVVGKRDLPFKAEFDALTVWYCHDFVVLRCEGVHDTPMIYSYEQLQMIQDATLARHNVYMALDMKMHCGSENLKRRVYSLIDWQDYCLRTHGNDGFELIKAPEALFKTHLTTLTSGDLLPYTSFERTVDKIMEKESKLSDSPTVVPMLVEIVKECDSIQDAVELFGLIKIAGHPVVYASKSARSARDEALKPDLCNPMSVIKVGRAVKHIILSAYINKHSEWPPLDPPPAIGSYLRRLMNDRVTELPLHSYPLSDLDTVEFGKFIEFDYSDDFLKFLDDKAISSGANELWKFWWPSTIKPERRLLLKALNEKKIDMHEIIDRLRRGKTTRDEEIVELTQKERELKNAARCFAKLPLPVRCFFTATEYNLGEYLMKDYFPQQTMTMSDAETKTRLYNMTFRTKGRKSAVLEVDFSRWNLAMRESLVKFVGRILEKPFGLPGIFSQAHAFFSRATWVLTDKHSLPDGAYPNTCAHDWPDSELKWGKYQIHLGGAEGLRQKKWTVATVGMSYIVMWDSDTTFIVAAQGDNLVLVLSFPEDADVVFRMIQLLAKMEVRCRSLNHTVKPDECIDSSTVLTYSKEIYIKGVHYQYSLKFLSRTMAIHDMDIPSLPAEVSAVCSSTVAAANSLPIPLKGYWWQLFRLIRLFREHARFSTNLNVSEHLRFLLSDRSLLKFALLLPGSLGGLPVLSWGRYLCRGEVDELSWDIAATVRLNACDILHRDLRLLCDKRYSPSKPDLSSLISDPASIPVRRPKDMRRIIREHLEDQLPRLTKNTWIHEIITNTVGAAGDKLTTALCATVPFYPSIMADIHEHSLAGLRMNIFGRFNFSRTIASAAGGKTFERVISQASADILSWTRFRYSEAKKSLVRPSYLPAHTFRIAARLRSFWLSGNAETLGTTHCPLAATLTNKIVTSDCISASIRTPLTTLMEEPGSYPPNFGTRTRQKTSEHGYKIITSSDTAKSIKHLVVTASQIGATGGMKEIIDNIVRSRCDWSLDTLAPVFPTVYGGAAAHRHQKLRAEHMGILGNQTVPTHLSLSSDRSGPLSGGEDDYPVVVQLFYLVLTNTFQVLSAGIRENTGPCAIGLVIPDLVALPAEPVGGATPPTTTWSISRDNKLAYMDNITILTKSIRPPETMIPPRVRKGRHTVQIASYLLTKSRIKSTNVLQPGNSVLYPSETFDIAEISGALLIDWITGLSIFTAIEAAYHIIRAGLSMQHHTRNTVVEAVASTVGPGIYRALISPASPHRDQLPEYGIACGLGRGAVVSASKRFTGLITERATSLIRSNYILSLTDPFILYADSASSGLPVLRKLAAFYILQPLSRDVKHLRMPRLARSQLMDAFFIPHGSGETITSITTGVEITKALLRAVVDNPNDSAAATAALAYSKWPPVVWDRRDADEARRDLRLVKARPLIDNQNYPVRRETRALPVIWTRKEIEFNGIEIPVIPRRSDVVTQRVETLLCRQIGVYTSALSVWCPVIQQCKFLRGMQTFYVVGVGNGASAEALNSIGAMQVTGIDLHSAIPEITQRETSITPAELRRSEIFKWSDHVFDEHQGDWYKLRHKISDAVLNPDTTCFVIDIEDPDNREILNLLPTKAGVHVILRLFANSTLLRWAIEQLQPLNVFNCGTKLREINPYIFHLVVKSTYPTRVCPGNITVTSIPCLRPVFEVDDHYRLQRVNRLIATDGVLLKQRSRDDLRRVIESLDETALNTDNVGTRRRLLSTLHILTTVDHLWHSNVEEITRVLVGEDNNIIRTVCGTLASLRPSYGDDEHFLG